jgi:SMC interacting uncharacterized protein involved in chromosome segregation
MIAQRVSLSAIQRRLDSIAIQQLRDEVARLATENDQLREQCQRAETLAEELRDIAESWRDDALEMQLELCEQSGGSPGITMGGDLVVIKVRQ